MELGPQVTSHIRLGAQQCNSDRAPHRPLVDVVLYHLAVCNPVALMILLEVTLGR